MTTRDDIARAAREAGWSGLYTQWAEPTGNPDWKPFKESLTVPVTAEQVERFFRAAYDAGAAAEREAWDPVQDSEWEVRADGKRVRKDRWQIGIRRIAALLWGNRQEFEVDEVVEAVRHLVPNPYAEGDDEALVKAVLDAAIRARGNT